MTDEEIRNQGFVPGVLLEMAAGPAPVCCGCGRSLDVVDQMADFIREQAECTTPHRWRERARDIAAELEDPLASAIQGVWNYTVDVKGYMPQRRADELRAELAKRGLTITQAQQ
jgi:hypothetical protein